MLAIFLDTETTGLDALIYHPIEIALKIIDLKNQALLGSYDSLIYQTENDWQKRDLNSIEINQLTWEEVKRGKRKEVVSQEIIDLFTKVGIRRGHSMFVCQNPSFDRSFFNQIVEVARQEALFWPYHWLDLASMYWARRLLIDGKKNKESLDQVLFSKDEIAKYYGLPKEDKPHRAMNGVNHLIECYLAVTSE